VSENIEARPAPCVIYAAKSTEDRHGSIPTQIDEARDMAEENGWIVVGVFTDEGFSAYSGNRGPGLANARAAAAEAAREHGTICMLIAQAHDRFARGAGDRPGAPESLGEVWHAMRRQDVHLRSVEDDEELRDEASVAAVGRRAHIDSRRKSKSTRKGITRAVEDRRKPWGVPGYGYRRIEVGDDAGHWEPNPEEEPIYLRIYRERIERGRTYSAIAKLLHAEGVPAREGGNWTSTHIKNILTRRYGLGEFHHGGKWLKGKHRPLIDLETWDAAQALQAMGAKYAPSRGGRKPHAHLFTHGLLRCSVCFEAMLPRSDGDRYACRTNIQLGGKGTCSMPDFKRDAIDREGLDFFERSFLDLDATREQIGSDLSARLEQIDAEAQRAAREASEKAAQIVRVERDYFAGELSAESYERLTARLTDDLAAADAERDRLSEHADALRSSRVELDAEGDALRRLSELRVAVLDAVRSAEQTADVDALRSAMHQCFSAVYLSPFGFLTGCDLPEGTRITKDGQPDDTVPEREGSWRECMGARVAFPTRRTTQHGTFVW